MHKTFLVAALGVLVAIVLEPLLGSFINPILAPLKLSI